MFETHDNDPHTRSHLHRPRLVALVIAAISVALVIFVLGSLIVSGEGSCPADSGLRPSTGLDGRTTCVSAR